MFADFFSISPREVTDYTIDKQIFTIEKNAKDFGELKPGPYVNLTIEDDGKGMNEETRKRIFEPFSTTKFQGRGLGMAAAYGVIKTMGVGFRLPLN